MNNIDFQELQRLRKENEELKQLLHEGRTLFSKVSELLNLKKIAQSNMLFAKLPLLIRTIQNNPMIIEDILQFLKKIEKYENTRTGQS